MALYTYRELYGLEMIDPRKILKQRFAESLDRDIQRMCVGAMQSYYPIDPDLLFTEQFRDALINNKTDKKFPNVYTVLKRNNTGLTGHGISALILQGTNDIVVYKSTQDDFVDALRRSGSRVDYRVLQGTRHDTRQDGFFIAREWMNKIARQKKIRMSE